MNTSPQHPNLETVFNEMRSLRLHGVDCVSEWNVLRVMRYQDRLGTLGSDDAGFALYSIKKRISN